MKLIRKGTPKAQTCREEEIQQGEDSFAVAVAAFVAEEGEIPQGEGQANPCQTSEIPMGKHGVGTVGEMMGIVPKHLNNSKKERILPVFYAILLRTDI